MINLIAAAAVFLGIHLLVSGTRLRDKIIARTGENIYVSLFALASLAAMIWLCVAYNVASTSPANSVLFTPSPWIKSLGLLAVAAALALAVPGVLRRNPTSAGQETAVINGILRVSRHPFLMGVTVWSLFHLLAKGTSAGTIFFSTFLVLAVFGTRAIDWKVERKRPDQWKKIAAATSVIPFVAILEKRNHFPTAEVVDWRISVAAAVFAAFLWSHDFLFGVPPFPAEWLVVLTAH